VKVTSVNVDATSLSFDDGRTVTADLIVAADGLHSTIRPHIIDTKKYYPKQTSGHNCLRFTISKQAMLDDPMTAKMISDDFRMFTWRDGRKAILAYSVDSDRQYNFNGVHPAQESNQDLQDQTESVAYNHKISLSTVQKIYSDFSPIALRMHDLADPDGFRIWPLMDMDDIPTWSANRTLLLGDACHPVLPFSFSGAGMAIEDATTLGILLNGADIKDVEGRLKVWEQMRRPRVSRVRQAGRTIAEGDDPAFIKPYKQFLESYDAVQDAKAKLKEYLGGR
jgi:salicylate hydroxylase